MLPPLFHALDIIGVAVFATTGALVASRKQMDLIGFALLATLTGIGGGTVRDIVLDRPVFWLMDQSYLVICMVVATISFFAAHLIQRRYPVLLWLDAVGLGAYGVLGAHVAVQSGAGLIVAAALGVITATFGGMMRDVLSQETPLILKQELYATAALAAAATYLGAVGLGASTWMAAVIGVAAGFALRAGAIQWNWSLPRYKPREGRSY
ncbi:MULTISPECIES: trimeric intracellular cation channel family protein [Rhodomicrobium]|uniref:trimeric intracellular cation channel family protein n=1 Tax=Rhodomicrobium TaxID=1068 RepID=UPI001FD98C0E|nr:MULTISPECIES: trimeric intracellular cation channel family protein [Rhodomicrobium]